MRFPGARLVKLRLNDAAKMQIYSKVVVHKSLSPNPTNLQRSTSSSPGISSTSAVRGIRNSGMTVGEKVPL